MAKPDKKVKKEAPAPKEPITKVAMTEAELQTEMERLQSEALTRCKALVEAAEMETGVRIIAQAHAPTKPKLGQPLSVEAVIVFKYDPSVREELKKKSDPTSPPADGELRGAKGR